MPVKTFFGTMPDGTAVEQYTLSRENISCDIITYGGALRSIRVLDRDGNTKDILLGFDTLEDYRKQIGYLGALVGRYANRICKGRFVLNGKEYTLALNDGANHLHGGDVGFDKQVWTVEDAGEDYLSLYLFSPDGQEGYPGNMKVWVTYRLNEDALSISYRASTDADTVCNLTNHAYFNLDGHENGPILENHMQINADSYTTTDEGSIPDGVIASVEGTPMDLRVMKPIGRDVDADFAQLAYAGGYDHNWVINGEGMREAAKVYSPKTGITMTVITDQPGIQFYSGNYMDGMPAGKGGAPYAKRWGFCMETQHFPDSPNRPGFPCVVLKAGCEFTTTTTYRFSVEDKQ